MENRFKIIHNESKNIIRIDFNCQGIQQFCNIGFDGALEDLNKNAEFLIDQAKSMLDKALENFKNRQEEN